MNRNTDPIVSVDVRITGVAPAWDASLDISKLLNQSGRILRRRMKRKGDDEIGSIGFSWLGPIGLELQAMDANVHHST